MSALIPASAYPPVVQPIRESLSEADRAWVCGAIEQIAADFNRSADTHLIRVTLPGLAGILLYLKDESTHPSGSLKHRLARSLFLYGLCNGKIRKGTTIIEASSGSTAVSEAYFAQLLGLPFIAVVPRGVARSKIAQVAFYGGQCHEVDACTIYDEAEKLARDRGGYFMDQFTYAERATDWRGNNNIAESLFSQMKREAHPVPDWVVIAAGTGGTSATIGRYIRYNPELFARTRLCVPDPEFSVFAPFYENGQRDLRSDRGSRIEGIGRPRVEPSFLPDVIDRMIRVPDAASLAAMHWLNGVLGRRVGGSTGTNLYAVLQLAAEMKAAGREGAIATILCDSGDRYSDTYYNPDWAQSEGLNLAPYTDQIARFAETGVWANLHAG